MTKLGANLGPGSCTFAVWAPFAQSVSVIGDFNGWDPTKGTLKLDPATGIWSNDFPAAKVGHQYKYYIKGPTWNPGPFERPDPYGRQMVHSAGPSIIKDPGAFAWKVSDFQTPAFEDMVIYEIHVPTFVGKNDGQKYPGNFQSLLTKLDYLRGLGVNTIELLPVHEYAGDAYLGYAPAAFFPVESSYGSQVGQSYDQLQAFVDAAHTKGLAVIIDVVFNHFTDRTGADKWIWDYDGDTFY